VGIGGDILEGRKWEMKTGLGRKAMVLDCWRKENKRRGGKHKKKGWLRDVRGENQKGKDCLKRWTKS